MTMRRPAGITVLAVFQFMSAAVVLGFAVACLSGRKAMLVLSAVLERMRTPEFPCSKTDWNSIGIAFVCFLLAILFFLFARGLWRLKNWARQVSVLFCLLDIIFGGLPSALGPAGMLIPANPLTYLAGRILSFLLLWYLFSPNVRTAFGVTEPRGKWLVPASALLTLAAFAYDFWHSGPELNAIRWHMHHGDQVTVNGVSFPVYYWYAPRLEDDGRGFEIKDEPGPMRPKEIGGVIRVSGRKQADESMSSDQLIDMQIQDYRKAHYPEPRRFQMQIAKQTLTCVEGGILGHRIDCYGTGPIASIFFTGGDRALMRFNTMMAESR